MISVADSILNTIYNGYLVFLLLILKILFKFNYMRNNLCLCYYLKLLLFKEAAWSK